MHDFLNEFQRAVVDAPPSGTLVLIAPTGVGRSTIVIRRAARLATQGSVLVVTARKELNEQYLSKRAHLDELGAAPDEVTAGSAIECMTELGLFARLEGSAKRFIYSSEGTPESLRQMLVEELGSVIPIPDEDLVRATSFLLDGQTARGAAMLGCEEANADLFARRVERRFLAQRTIPHDLADVLLACAVRRSVQRWDHVLFDDWPMPRRRSASVLALARVSTTLVALVDPGELPEAAAPVTRIRLTPVVEFPVASVVAVPEGEMGAAVRGALDECLSRGEGARRTVVVALTMRARALASAEVGHWLDQNLTMVTASGMTVDVMVLDSMHGLEFDAAVVVIDHRPWGPIKAGDPDPNRVRAYLAMTRARNWLRILLSAQVVSQWLPLLGDSHGRVEHV